MLDAVRFLKDEFGTAADVVAVLRAYRFPHPSEATCVKWYQRGSIPTEWFCVLLAAKELDNGAPLSVIKYMTSRGG